MAMLHAAGAAGVAYVQAHDPDRWSSAAAMALGVLVAAGAVWGAVDVLLRRTNRGLTWLYACAAAGVLAGPLTLVLQAVLVDSTGVEELGGALLGGAFTALLVLGSAALGLGAGRLLFRRRADPAQASVAIQRSASA